MRIFKLTISAQRLKTALKSDDLKDYKVHSPTYLRVSDITGKVSDIWMLFGRAVSISMVENLK